ncbi:MAG: ATP-binding protein [bacterium]|nr:ATP-binding protein [bacterium]
MNCTNLTAPKGQDIIAQGSALGTEEEKPTEIIRVLLIEDNPGDANLIRERLAEVRDTTFDLKHADRLSTGLAFIAGGKTDVILLDLSLPESQGLDTFTRVHAQIPEIPIVVLTGFNDERLAVKAVQEGAQDYLVKGVADGKVLSRVMRYAIERKRVEAKLRHYAERLSTLRDIDRAILAAQSPEAIAQAALDHIRQLIPCRRASVAVFDFGTDEALVLAVHVDGKTKLGTGVRFPLEGFGGIEKLRHGEVIVVEDIRSLSQPTSVDQRLRAEGLRSYINVPLLLQSELIGSFNLGSGSSGYFTSEYVDIAREVANPLAIAIHQARLHEQVKHHTAELEQRVIERTAQLQEINAELEAFTYNVSHELRAPLRGMQAFSGALLDDCGDRLDLNGRSYAQHIIDAAQYMDALISDLLDYSRLSSAEISLKPVSLEKIVEKVMRQLELEIREKEARITVERPLPQVVGDSIILRHILANLLTNAVKFVDSGVQPRVKIWTEERDEWVRLWVEDNGLGIAPEHWERIFRVFDRLHGIESYPGTGIGLAIVRKGIERMGGRVGLESIPGKGSRFWVEMRRQ